jgi:hypothetical protein
MKAICLRRKVSAKETFLQRVPESGEYDSGLKEGCWYVIYGIVILDGKPFYLVHQEEDILYPVLMPIRCFGCPVGNVSSLFHVSLQSYEEKQSVILSSQLFLEHPTLYEHLLECSEDDPLMRLWSEFRQAVEAEECFEDYKRNR